MVPGLKGRDSFIVHLHTVDDGAGTRWTHGTIKHIKTQEAISFLQMSDMLRFIDSSVGRRTVGDDEQDRDDPDIDLGSSGWAFE